MNFPKITNRPRPDPSYIRGSITLRDLVERFPLDSVISSKVFDANDYQMPYSAICVVPPDGGKAWIAKQFKKIPLMPKRSCKYNYWDELDTDFDGGEW